MCKTIAAPLVLPGRLMIDPFRRMARGRNALNGVNTAFGERTRGDGCGAVYESDGNYRSLQRANLVEQSVPGQTATRPARPSPCA